MEKYSTKKFEGQIEAKYNDKRKDVKMEQLSIFDLMYPKFQIDKPIRLIELFSGVGTQSMALRDLGVDFENWRTCEWETHATASYKAIHCADDNTDYSEPWTDEQVANMLFRFGISTNGKTPLSLEQIKSSTYGESWRRTAYNNIMATHNLVDISKTRGGDLGITNTDHFTYIMTYSFP